jgi:hypothetical protein
MKVGDLVRGSCGNLGLVVEEEIYEGAPSTWVWYFDDPSWRWYSFEERYDAEVISESR